MGVCNNNSIDMWIHEFPPTYRRIYGNKVIILARSSDFEGPLQARVLYFWGLWKGFIWIRARVVQLFMGHPVFSNSKALKLKNGFTSLTFALRLKLCFLHENWSLSSMVLLQRSVICSTVYFHSRISFFFCIRTLSFYNI